MTERRVVDFHAHIFPESLARKAMISLAERSLLPFFTNGGGDGLVKSMERAGITHSVICNISVKPGQSGNVLQFASQIKDKYPAASTPAFIPFGSVHPREENWRELLAEVKSRGLKGIKLHPDYQEFYINDPAMESFYKEAIRLDLVMLFHAGVDVGYPDPVHADVKRMYDILPVLEKGKAVFAHMGGFLMEREVLGLLCGRNVYFDTSYSLDKMDLSTARDIFKKHGPERMLFATDTPWVDTKKYLAYFDNTLAKGFLSDEDADRVLYANAAELLGL